jgi:hypothetical protein
MGLKKPESKIRKPTSSGSATAPSRSVSGPKRKIRPAITAKPEVKTRRTGAAAPKKKKRKYTEEELGIPKLNGIIPAGVQKPRGKKIGKVFVDDAQSMLAILAVVNAEKEGEREGKIKKEVRVSIPLRQESYIRANVFMYRDIWRRFEKRRDKRQSRGWRRKSISW